MNDMRPRYAGQECLEVRMCPMSTIERFPDYLSYVILLSLGAAQGDFQGDFWAHSSSFDINSLAISHTNLKLGILILENCTLNPDYVSPM